MTGPSEASGTGFRDRSATSERGSRQRPVASPAGPAGRSGAGCAGRAREAAMDERAEVEARLAVALPMVEEAGRLALAHFRRPIAVENKLGPGAFDPVTAADRERRGADPRRLGRGLARQPDRGRGGGLHPGRQRLVLDHRPDRRHPRLHLRRARLGDAARAAQGRRARSAASCASPTSTRPSSAARRRLARHAGARPAREPRAGPTSARRSSTRPSPACSPTRASRPASTGSPPRCG